MSFDTYAASHNPEHQNGPGDGRPTAHQIIQDNDLAGKWTDKVVLITGCSSGIGIETARALKETGAKVYATARNLEKGRKALGDILEPGRCELLALRLDSLASVRACAAEFQARERELHVLVNNAGIGDVTNKTRQTTADGFEAHFGTNHLGHFLLFQLLRPQLHAASTPGFHARVVNVSSAAHRFCPVDLDDPNLADQAGGYDPWKAYGNSKTANIWMANQIERAYGGGGAGAAIHGLSVHPGVIQTGFGGVTDWDEFLKKDPTLAKRMKSPEQGATTSVWAAAAPVWEGKGGKYLADVQVAKIVDPKEPQASGTAGCLPWAYDEEGEKKLWAISNELVGFTET